MVWENGHQLQGGKYVIEKVLGQGGFCITYKAFHLLLKKSVSIKAPNPSLRHDPEYGKFVRRFTAEAQQLAKISQLRHPHLVSVNDLFEEAGTPCLVLDYVAGETLFALVQQQGALSEMKAIRYIRQVGEGLCLLHQRGIVHRAPYPRNIVLSDAKNAVLINFGVAGEILPNRASFKFLAHPAFLPYEAMGGSKEITVDVYCLAASLYYAVTGRLPATSLQRLNHQPVIPPVQYQPQLSSTLNAAILAGIELDARTRTQTIQEWLLLLEPIGSFGLTSATLSPSFTPAIRPQTHPKEKFQPSQAGLPWLWLIGVMVGYSVLGFFGGHWAWLEIILCGGAVGASWLVIAWGAEIGGIAGAIAGGLAWVVAVIGAIIWAEKGMGATAVAIAVALAGLGAWFIAVAGAIDDLLKVCPPAQTLAIVSGMSWLGLVLGWFCYQRFPLF